MDNLKTVIAYYRGQPGTTIRQALKALHALLAVGVDHVPAAEEAQPAVVKDAESAIAHLEKAAAAGMRGPQGLMPLAWAELTPVLMQLAGQWHAKLATHA